MVIITKFQRGYRTTVSFKYFMLFNRFFSINIKNLPQNSKKEIFLLWKDFKEQKSKEARYLNQFYVFNTLLQALLYWQEDKKFPIAPWWEWAFERVESSEVLELLKELKKRFYNSRQAF